MIPEIFTILAGFGLVGALVANGRPPVIIGLPSTITGFFMAELGRALIPVQMVVTAVWVAVGALDEPIGFVGLGLTVAGWLLLVLADRRSRRVPDVLDAQVPVLRTLDVDRSPVRLRATLRPSFEGVEIRRNETYGPEARNHADVYLPAERVGAPIVLQIHGGGWVAGKKEQQGQPLLSHFTAQGWIGVAINYRMGPKHRLPAAVHDVKRAIAWIREQAPSWGGDAGQILVTGGSAGGHLTALAALTIGDRSLQPGFEDADCSVAAAAPMYGVFDMTDAAGHRGRSRMTPFLDRMVMSTRHADDPVGWNALSPITRLHPDSPPMFAVSCAYDTLVPIAESRDFGRALVEISPDSHFVELPHAHHAFDVIGGVRATHVIRAVERWASSVVARGPVDA
ncbi:MAG: alpha/beta hydrolase [Acidimicrobiales bacterium]|nr:alpha/beta hydrolase [Acidimicrobiales bacterium]